MFLRRKKADRHVRGGLLNRIHQPVQSVEQVKVPNFQIAGFKQKEHSKGGQRRKTVAGQHGNFFIPAVAQRAGKNTEQHIRRIGTDWQKRSGKRRSLPFVRPDDQREAGHGTAKGWQSLGRPQKDKRM